MIRPFTLDDLPALNDWRAAHGLEPLTAALVPETGLLVPGVAAVLLYRAECGLAFVSELVTNPAASANERHAALELLAAWLKVRTGRLFFWTQDASVQRRAEAMGFQVCGTFTVLARG